MDWENAGGAYAPVRISLEMARRNHASAFLQRYPTAQPADTRGFPIAVIALEELGVPNLLVSLAWRGLYLDGLGEVFEHLAGRLDVIERTGEPKIAVLNAPFDPFVRLLPQLQARGYYVMYFPQDDYADMERLGYREYNVRAEAELVERADAVIALSKPVANRLSKQRAEIAVVPDAVDPDEFRARSASPAPPEILRGQKVTLGLWGNLIASMVDAPLLEAIARAKPEWAINLIGPYDPEPGFASLYQTLSPLPNVRFLGPVAHSELVRYGSAFDVCLLPGPDNDMSRGRDPLKFYEYLACYKPIVATHMPQLAGFPYVRVAYATAQAIRCIEDAVADKVDHGQIDAFLAQNTWSVRGERFMDIVQEMTTRPPAQRGALDATQLEAFGKAMQVGVLSSREGASVASLVREYYVLRQELARVNQQMHLNEQEHARQVQQLEAWARSLEAANREQQQTLARISQFLPLRVMRYFQQRLLPRGAR